jgi:hypothetical protein
MKNISDLLRTGNLTPKERILMCIHNEIHERQTGESILTKADLHALSKGWNPKDNFEVQEYNKYYNAWDVVRLLKMDMQTTYLNTIIDIRSMERVLAYFVYGKEPKNIFEGKGFDDEALNEVLRNTGLDYNLLLHRLTFDALPSDVQKDILALDPDASNSQEYFDDEEKLYNILNRKTALTTEEVDTLTDIIIDSIPWEYLTFITDKGLDFMNILFSGYFASIPLIVFAEKLAKKFRIEYKDEEDLKAKVTKVPNLKHELRTLINDEICNGLFFRDYIPLCNSATYATCNDIDTKLPHHKLMELWMKEKGKQRDFLQGYINSGKLLVEDRHKELFMVSKYYKSITGESLYYLDEDLPFVKDYKKQVEKLLVLGCLVAFIKKRPFLQYYAELLYFNMFLKKASKIFEIDLSYYGESYTNTIKEEMKLINDQITLISEKVEADLYMKNDIGHHVEIYIHDMYIPIENIEPITNNSLELADKKVSEYFKEWRGLLS